MANLEKTFTFRADAAVARKQAEASKLMTPAERAAAFLARMSNPAMIRQGRVF